MSVNSIAMFVFICGAMTFAIAIYAWRHRSTNGARLFSALMTSMAIYVLGYGFELSSLDLNTMLIWSKVEYVGILTFPTIYLFFAAQYSGNTKWITKGKVILLFIVPALLLVLKLFDNSLHLIYRAAEVDRSGLIPLLSFTKGPVYILVVAYNLINVTVGTFLLFVKRRYASMLYRRQTNMILGASFIIYLTYLVYLSGITIFPNLKQLDLNPFIYTLWGLNIGYAIFRYRLFDLAPIARDALIELLGDGVIVLDEQYRLMDSNPKAQAIFNWQSTPIGKTVSELKLDFINKPILDDLTGSYCYEVKISCAEKSVDFETTVTCLQNHQQDKIGFLLVLHDISQRKKVEKELAELTLVDDLTGLINRRGFFLLSDQLFNFCSRMHMNAALFFLDMDGLKKINDNLGHAAGDQALIDMSQILKKSFRSSDIVARFGGDEFVILAIETNGNSSKSMSDRFEKQLEAFNLKSKREYRLSISTGIAHYDWENPQSMEDLLRSSDKTMYEIKTIKKQNTF